MKWNLEDTSDWTKKCMHPTGACNCGVISHAANTSKYSLGEISVHKLKLHYQIINATNTTINP